jgi:hypothetical protein
VNTVMNLRFPYNTNTFDMLKNCQLLKDFCAVKYEFKTLGTFPVRGCFYHGLIDCDSL